MRPTLTPFALAPTLRRRMRSGEAGGRGAPSYGIAWLLLALACLVLALPGKAAPNRATSQTAHSAVQVSGAEHAALTAVSASDIASLAPASDEDEPEALPALSEPSAEKEPSGDKYRRPYGTGFPASAGLTRTAPITDVARDCGSTAEGRLPPAHASPATC